MACTETLNWINQKYLESFIISLHLACGLKSGRAGMNFARLNELLSKNHEEHKEKRFKNYLKSPS
jgi:hypothetical protein